LQFFSISPAAVQQSTAATHDESMESFSDSYEEDVNKSLLNLSSLSHVLNQIESKFLFIRCCQVEIGYVLQKEIRTSTILDSFSFHIHSRVLLNV